MKNRFQIILVTLFIGGIILVGGLALDLSQPTQASLQPSTDITLGVEESEQEVIRIYYDNKEQLNAVAGELDIWELQHTPGIGTNSGYAIAAVYPAQKDWLVSLGYRVEVDQEHTQLLQAPNVKLDERYYYFDNYNNNANDRYIVDFLQDMNTTYPNLVELIDIGDAWLSYQPGGYHRDILVLRISNEDPAFGDIATKPPFFLFASVHAREVSTPEMSIRYIKYLTSGYNGLGGYDIDPDVTWLVNHHVTYVLVTENPDGRAVNEADYGMYWRKNVDNNDGCADPYNWGVDLNRNSSFKWGCCGGSSGQPCAATYRGPTRGSEPEIDAFQTFAASIFTDWNGANGDDEIGAASPLDASGLFISLHSYQDEILWPFGFSPGGAPNNAQLMTIGRKLADITTVMNPTGFLYTVDGSNDDWVYGKLGVAAFTYEIGPTYGQCADFFPPYGCQEGTDGMNRNFWTEMRPSFVYANKIAGSPFMTSYGPDTQAVTVNPTDVPGGMPVDLAGTVLDQRYSNDPLQPVMGAEYFIDAPGADGTGVPMSPTDGAWGETNELVEAIVDTSGLSEGKHYILVHGLNDDGAWGPFTAVFLNVTTPAYGVMLTPETASAQADPGQVVTYQLQVNNIGLNSDSYDISVASAWAYSAPSTIGPIAPGETATLDVQVTVPADAFNGESDTAVISVVSQYNSATSDSSSLTSIANLYELILTPVDSASDGYPGGQIQYTLQLTNQGNITDTFNIQSNSGWIITHPSTVGPLHPGAFTDIIVIVDVPPSALPGDFDTATLTATSQGDTSKSQTASLTSNAIQAGPFVDPVSAAASGDPGSQVTYSVLLSNHNYLEDTFAVTVQTVWGMNYPFIVGPIPADGSTYVDFTVSVPADADGGASDTALVTFTSSFDQLPAATATLVTSANNLYAFQAIPDNDTLIGYGRGATVEYSVQVTNTGNTPDTYNLYVLSSEWTVIVPPHVGPIGRGESVTVSVYVHVPFDIVMGDSNHATIAFVSQGNSLIGQQVHIYTDTFWYNNFLPLSQRH